MTTSEPLASKPAEPDRSRLFWAAAAVIVGLQILLGLIAFPPGLRIGPIPAVAAVTILSGVVVLGASLTGLFLAASRSWTAGRAALWLAGGIAVQAGSVLALGFLKPAGPVVVLLQGAAQGGLLVWCAGLGALIALLFRDRNLIVPVCIFLAGFDAWLILSPHTFTSQMVQGNSQIFQSVAAQVPTAREAPRPEAPPEERAPRVVPAAYIGPADFIFSMAFFACLFRLRMKVRETVRWLIPVLVFYLGLVFFTPFGMLPALVPIGLTVLIVNAREFTMTRDEKLGVWIVSVVSVALAVLGVWQRVNYVPPKPPAEPSIQAPGPEGPAPEASPEPAAPGPLPS